jgi:hypothetical protein
MPGELYDPKEWTPDPSAVRVPPPPPQLKVRTMQSDIGTLAARGGNFSSDVSVPSSPLAAAPRVPFSEREAVRPAVLSFITPRALIIAGSAALLVVVGVAAYYLTAIFSPDNANDTNPPSQAPPVVSVPLRTDFEHQSLFRLPADQAFDLELSSSPVTDVSELQTYSQKLSNILSGIRDGGFVEINIRNEEGDPLSVAEFFSALDAGVMPPDFLEANFNSDFTVFVHKEKGTLFPGYAVSLKKGLTALVLQAEVLDRIERSGDYVNLFTDFPGVAAPEGFRDKQVGTRPVRSLTFTSDEGGKSEFLYSWFNSAVLVLSTSEKGLTKAFELLGR